jgi:sulfoxide reductase catalytic subunit YedY
MLVKKPDEIKSSEITDERHHASRREFLRGGLLAGSVVATGALYRALTSATPSAKPRVTPAPETAFARTWDVPDENATGFDYVAGYNNYYEFSTSKRGVAAAAENFVTRPWTVTVDGLCARPRTFDLDELQRLFPLEERVYRHRCVEAWSMVVPWLGFPLASLLELVEPLSTATYVELHTLLDPDRMPNQRTSILRWPYVEGLRLDEATHPLALLSTGLYGKLLLPQNGAPLRLVVPWKYGFKGAKSIVRIRLVDALPATTWALSAPDEYGFFANVNPAVDHPRWSQASERRIGDYVMRPTLPFNGYAEQVAGLYAGLDLRANF